jgi:hypothetical protein
MTMHRLMSLIAMAFLWTGSQIPLYLFGELETIIFEALANPSKVVFHHISMESSEELIDGCGSFSQTFSLLQQSAHSLVQSLI